MKLLVLQYQKLHPELSDAYTLTTKDFKQQLVMLKKSGYSSISCSDLYNYLMKTGELPKKPILISFDDGFISQYRHAAPILEEQGFHAVFFVTAESVLTSCCSKVTEGEAFMNADQLKELHQIGFEIGLHGYAGLNFAKSKLSDIRLDIVRSILFFEKLKFPLTNVLAYPRGTKPVFFWRTRGLHRMLKQEKIMLAFNGGDRVNTLSGTHRFNIYRIRIKGNDINVNFIKNVIER